jgi:zinc/manganese transport system permease protein
MSGTSFSWNPATDLQDLWAYPFMVNAFRAGAVVAVLAGVMGWFMVLRRQTFAGHSLSIVAFPGAAGATLIGVSAVYGYFAFCVGAAVILALAARGRQGSSGRLGQESALIGTLQAFALACGLLFVALYHGFLEGFTALLFGSFLGITQGQVILLAVVAVGVLGVLAVIGRPLLFASADPEVAAARGLPVRALSALFLVLLGAAVAETSQITGALLVFALLVMPAATAQRLTARPLPSLLATIGIGWMVTWAGLVAAYYSPYPIGFYVTTFAFAAYLTAHLLDSLAGRAARRPERSLPEPPGRLTDLAEGTA